MRFCYRRFRNFVFKISACVFGVLGLSSRYSVLRDWDIPFYEIPWFFLEIYWFYSLIFPEIIGLSYVRSFFLKISGFRSYKFQDSVLLRFLEILENHMRIIGYEDYIFPISVFLIFRDCVIWNYEINCFEISLFEDSILPSLQARPLTSQDSRFLFFCKSSNLSSSFPVIYRFWNFKILFFEFPFPSKEFRSSIYRNYVLRDPGISIVWNLRLIICKSKNCSKNFISFY